MSLSIIILTHNNQDTIAAHLSSLSWASELIIIDNYSTDQTIKIAKKFATKVYQRLLANNWATQRNFALKKSSSNWVLFIDSDEVVSSSLKKEILSNIKNTDTKGFFLKRQDMFLGKILKHGETSKVKLLRLAQKNTGLWQRPVHETWVIKGSTKTLKNSLLHQRNLTISQFIARLNHYTDIDTQALIAEGKHFSFFHLFTKPTGKFIYNYLILLGFLDGFPGFALAFLMSFHSLIVRIKLWERKQST